MMMMCQSGALNLHLPACLQPRPPMLTKQNAVRPRRRGCAVLLAPLGLTSAIPTVCAEV
jgi:hypothetical protein